MIKDIEITMKVRKSDNMKVLTLKSHVVSKFCSFGTNSYEMMLNSPFRRMLFLELEDTILKPPLFDPPL